MYTNTILQDSSAIYKVIKYVYYIYLCALLYKLQNFASISSRLHTILSLYFRPYVHTHTLFVSPFDRSACTPKKKRYFSQLHASAPFSLRPFGTPARCQCFAPAKQKYSPAPICTSILISARVIFRPRASAGIM